MKLSAVYIPKSSLEYIFGENHEGVVINFDNHYEFKIEETNNNIFIDKCEEYQTIDKDFWGEGILSISAVVGRNGIGKTTILRALNIQQDSKHINVLYFYDNNEGELLVYQEATKNIEINKNLNKRIRIIDNVNRLVEREYYSPVLDYDLRDAFSSISQINYAKGTLEEYYIDSISRNALLLSEPIIEQLIEAYPDFPQYEKYHIKAKKQRQSHFLNVYAISNFANTKRNDVVRNHIDGDLNRILNDPNDFPISKSYFENVLQGYLNIIDGSSFNSLFRELWNLDEYNSKNEYDFIHSQVNFKKDIEVTLLSYLLLGAVFAKNGLGGETKFNDLLKERNFYLKLDKFLEQYFIQTDAAFAEKILEDFGRISIDDKSKIQDVIQNSFKFTRINGVDMEKVRENLSEHLKTFATVKSFYAKTVRLIELDIFQVEEGVAVFNIRNSSIELLNEYLDTYKKLLEQFNYIPVTVSILEFSPDKKLSSGEKSLIDFYSSLNNYLDRNKSRNHQCFENYILLLDEPELGYHPIWKKKFVHAIVKTLPVLFSKIEPHKYDPVTKKTIRSDRKNPNIQVIFTTHDPLTLSDIPNTNIIYLDKDENNHTKIVNQELNSKKSFGANITDLLADSFFIEDGLIGDFAKEKIERAISWLNNENRNLEEKLTHRKLITLVQEPVLKAKLNEMYYNLFPYEFDREYKEAKLQELAKKYNVKIYIKP